jgi:hypothetical protein
MTRLPVSCVLVLTSWLSFLAWGPSCSEALAEAVNETLAHQALRKRLADGLAGSRALLETVTRELPGQRLARWHLGQVQCGAAWIHVDDLARLSPWRAELESYQWQRERFGDDLASHWSLANWCRQRKLSQQERAHLTRVLQLAPDHQAARQRLGYQRIDGQWVAAQDLWQADQVSRRLRQALRRWHPRAARIEQALSHRRLDQRTAAEAAMAAIDEPEAIPALEIVFLGQDSPHAARGLEAIARLPQFEASQALARQAVVHRHPSLRNLAIRHLTSRAWEDYVPALLAALASPIQSQVAIDFVDGQLLYRHAFHRQGWEQNDLAVADTRYTPGPQFVAAEPDSGRARRRQSSTAIDSPEAAPDQLAWQALANAAERAARREQVRRRHNAAVEVRNGRIMHVLAQVTDQRQLDEPADWWSWWDEYQGVHYLGRPTNTRYTRSDIAMQRSVAVAPISTARHECFAPGTPVWTAMGPVAIETLRVGDLVLSQDVETGELALKPVLAATVRPAEQLVSVDLGREQIESTAGHPYWVLGEGWTLARKLSTEKFPYALDTTATVQAVRKGAESVSHNLVVADFHTYLVGQSRLLVHDNTRPRPTNCLIPGLPGSQAAPEAETAF